MRFFQLSCVLLALQGLSAEELEVNIPLEVDLGIKGAVELNFDTQIGVYYQIEISEDLTNWDNEGYAIKGTGGNLSTKVSSRNFSRVFYRLRDDGSPQNVAPSPTPAGSVMMFAGTAAPDGWVLCDGASYSREDYAGLFSAIGEMYGSENSSSFNVPDLRGRVAMGAGQGTNLSQRDLGETTGAETHTLTVNQLPSHTHWYWDIINPDFNSLHASNIGQNPRDETQSGDVTGGNAVLRETNATGNDQAHNIVQPSLVLNYIIKL